MTDKAHYIIQKQILDIRQRKRGNAFAMQNKISALYRKSVLPLLEKTCHELCPGDQLVKIDTLIVEVPAMTESQLSGKWAEAVEKAFRKSFIKAMEESTAPEDKNVRYLSQTEADLELLTYFLYNGTLPWSYSENRERTPEILFRELIANNPTAIRQLLTEGLKQKDFTKRLCYQFPDLLLTELPGLLQPTHAKHFRNSYKALQRSLESTAGFKDRYDTAFLLGYHSIQQLAKQLHWNEKRFITAVLQQIAQAWKIPYRDMLGRLLQNVETAETAMQPDYRIVLETLYEETAAVSTDEPKPEEPASSHHLQEQLQQILRAADRIAKAIGEEKTMLYDDLKAQLIPLTKLLESDAPEAGKAIEDLETTLEQLLRKLEQDSKAFVKAQEDLRTALEEPARDELKPAKPAAPHLQTALRQLLREAERYAVELEKNTLYESLKDRLMQFIKLVRSEAPEAVKTVENFEKEVTQMLRKFEKDRERFKTTLEELARDEIKSESAASRFQKQLRQLLREAARIEDTIREGKALLPEKLKEYLTPLESDTPETAKVFETFRKELSGLLQDFEPDIKGHEAFKGSVEKLLERLKQDQSPEATSELRQLLREAEKIAGTIKEEKALLHKKLKKRLMSFIRSVKTDAPEAAKAVEILEKELEKLPGKSEPGSEASETLKRSVEELLEDITQKTEKKRDMPEELRDDPDAVYLQNAGMVIVWPFFTQLFEGLKYTENKQFISEEKQHRAVHLLQYLVNGKEDCEEHLLPLNKLLCGLPISEPVPRQPALAGEEKEAAENLIKAAIKHWPVMKNTSVAGFRGSFLIREGKLSKIDNGWLLKAAQKSYDVIMDKLPWGIGLVKLPWMPEPLHVEW